MKTARDEKYLTLALGEDLYGVLASFVREIMELPAITRVPGMQPMIRGVTNLRGIILPVIDLRVLVDLPPAPDRKHACLVVVEHQDQLTAWLVDTVHEVVSVDPGMLWPLSGANGACASTVVEGAHEGRERPVLILHVERVLARAGLSSASPASCPADSRIPAIRAAG